MPELIFQTEANENGIWQIYINKDLAVGKYALWAVASQDGLQSGPSEKVYFTLTAKYQVQPPTKIAWWLIIIIILVILLLGTLLLYINKKIKEKREASKKIKHESQD